MERRLYGSGDQNVQTGILPHAGDPEFDTDSQNNDEAYCYDTDLRNSVRDPSGAMDDMT